MNPQHFFTPFSKHLRSGEGMDPARDWMVLLLSATLIFAGIVVWNAWAFDTIANGGSIGTEDAGVPAIFDRYSLEAIDEIFRNRAMEESKYATGVYRYNDPSQ